MGLCLSGGGVRAMAAALGTLTAAEEMGVLGCCTYVAGLSGANILGLSGANMLYIFIHTHTYTHNNFVGVLDGRAHAFPNNFPAIFRHFSTPFTVFQ